MYINEFVEFLTTDDIEYVKDLFTELDTVYKTEMNNFYYSKEQKTTHQIKFIDKDVRQKLNNFIRDLDLVESYKGIKFQDVWNPNKEFKHLYNGSREDTKERLYYALKYQLLIYHQPIFDIKDISIRRCAIYCIFFKLFVDINNVMTYNANGIQTYNPIIPTDYILYIGDRYENEFNNNNDTYIKTISGRMVDINKGSYKKFFKSKKFDKEFLVNLISDYQKEHNENPTYDTIVDLCNTYLRKQIISNGGKREEYNDIRTNKKQIQYYVRLYDLGDLIRKMDYKSRKDAKNIKN